MKFKEKDFTNAVVFGMPRVGKTSLLKKIVFSLLHKDRNIYIIDPEIEFDDHVFTRYCKVISDPRPIEALEMCVDIEKKYFIGKNYKNEKKCLLIVDEAHLFIPLRSATTISDYILRFITGGAKRGMHVVLATQRPARLEITPRTLWRSAFCFRLRGRDMEMAHRDLSLNPEWKRIIPEFDVGQFLAIRGNHKPKILNLRWGTSHEEEGEFIFL